MTPERGSIVVGAVMTGRVVRASLWMAAMGVLLFALLLTFSRGALINLAVSFTAYAYFILGTAGTNRQRLKLVVSLLLAGALAVSVLAAAQSIPTVADLMGERAALDQSYDVGPEGRFGGQQKAVGLIDRQLQYVRNIFPIMRHLQGLV